MKMVLKSVLVASLVVLAGWPAVADVVLEVVDECWVAPEEREQVDCYRVLVPLDRKNPDAGTVDLAVAVLRATTGRPNDDPVMYLEGGPGAPVFADGYPAYEEYSDYWWWMSAPFRRTRDFILFDQRGIGLSRPSLDCVEFHELHDALPILMAWDYPLERREVRAAEQCYERLALEEGIDLNQFDTRASADDVADIVRVLGYEEVNLWGISYGSRLALEVMRRHPGIVRASVIDGVYPGLIDEEIGFASSVAGAFSNLFEDCEADRQCSRLVPDMASYFSALITELNEEPREMELFDPHDGTPAPRVELNGNEIVSSMIGDLYDSDALTLIPLMIGASRREIGALTYTWGSGSFGSDGSDEGVFINIGCRESTTLDFDMVAAETQAEGIFGEATLNWSLIPFCDVWPVERAPLADEGSIVSDIPTLLFSGRYDPITPPAYAELAAETLSNSRHFVFRSGGHGVTATYNCATVTAARFFVNPDPRRTPSPRCREYTASATFALEF